MMKRIVSILVALIIALPVLSQSIIQKGVTYRYNGKNPRTPIGGVYIKPISADNGVVSDASNGSFSVILKNLTMGARIGKVKVTKQGMMVFNQMAVDEWSVRKEPLCLILCDANEFQKQKKNLIAIGEREAKRKYDNKLAELKKENETQKIKLDDYYNQLDSLEKEYQNALKHMDEYADVFARIDESEIDSIAQRAIELFNNGAIEESIKMFEEGNYLKKLDDALRVKSQTKSMRQLADSVESLAERDIEKYIGNIKAQIAAYKLSKDYPKTGETLKNLADRIQNPETIGEYLDFCYDQNRFQELELYAQKIISILGQVQNENKEEILAATYNCLGYLYSNTQRFSEGETMFKLAMSKYEQIAKVDHKGCELKIVILYNNLGLLYHNVKRFKESEAMYKAALEKCNKLIGKDSLTYESTLSMVYHNFASLYSDIKQISESDRMYRTACTIRKLLAKTEIPKYEQDLANSYNDYAMFCVDIHRFKEAEKLYNNAVSIYKHLVNENAEAYEPGLAKTYNNLGLLYSQTLRFNESEAILKSALAINERLVKANSQIYESQLAITYNNLAILYSITHNDEECEVMFKAALYLYIKLANVNPKVYEPNLAGLYNNLGVLYSKIFRYDESETMYMSALKIRERLTKIYPNVFDSELASSYNNLAMLYNEIRKFKECENLHKAALTIRERLAKVKPKIFNSDLAASYGSLSILYATLNRLDESAMMGKAAVNIYKHLICEEGEKVYEPQLAAVYNNLAIIYCKALNFKESEDMCNAAQSLYKRLVKDNPNAYEEDLARLYRNLADLYHDAKRFQESEDAYHKCLNAYFQLYERNPQKYTNAMAVCYYLLGYTMVENGKNNDAIYAFKESLKFVENIKDEEIVKKIYVVNILFVNILYVSCGDCEAAYVFNEKYLTNIKKLFENKKEIWKEDYCKVLTRQSLNANLMEKFSEGEQYSLKAIEVNPSHHSAYTNLAPALLFQKKINEAEKIYLQYKPELKGAFLDDFSLYERLNVIPKECEADVERIKKMLLE